ncbi:MAG: methyltransferase domain-containing protein, partial [Candidatus Hadarchaeota archaeon]
PGTMVPTLARCMVNLARTPRKGIFLDPFCGVGGILLEAGLIGAKLIGVDIERGLVEGARKNLAESGLSDFQLMVGDARKLPPLEADAIATDPPYGRQTTTGGTELQELYKEALPSMAGVLKKKAYVCITSPAELELEDIASGAGLRMIEKHDQRVHRSLTRRIYVFRRK